MFLLFNSFKDGKPFGFSGFTDWHGVIMTNFTVRAILIFSGYHFLIFLINEIIRKSMDSEKKMIL